MFQYRHYKDFIRFYNYPDDKFSSKQKYLIECILTFFSLIRYDRFFVRIIAYFLLKASDDFDIKVIAELTKYSYIQIRRMNKLSPEKFRRIYRNPLSGPGVPMTIPTVTAGEIASWIINNQCDCPSKVAVFLAEEHRLAVSTRTVSRFLQIHGLDKILQMQPREELIGRTKFLGGWLLVPPLLSLLRELTPIFGQEAGSFSITFLTIFFASLFGIHRQYHLDDISDIYQASREYGVDLGDQDQRVSLDEHVVVRWTKIFQMAGTLWPTRGKSGNADKLFYVYSLKKKLLLSCLPLPANKRLSYCMVRLINDLRETYGVQRIRAILDAGGCKGFPLAMLMRIPGVVFIVKGCRWPDLVDQWERIPRTQFIKRVDPADRYRRNQGERKRYLRVTETYTKIKGCAQPLRTILIWRPKEEKMKDRYIPLFTNDETSDMSFLIWEYRSRQNHEMVYRDMKYTLGLDAIPSSISPGQDRSSKRFYSKRLLFFGWTKALVFNAVQDFKRNFAAPIANMRIGTLARKFFSRPGTIFMTDDKVILQFDYFNGQNDLMPFCEQLNVGEVSIPWMGNREMQFRFIPKPTKAKITNDWWQSF